MPYAVVPLANGTLPPGWPEGFDRAGLRGPVAVVNDLLALYGIPRPHAVLARRNALAVHIGTRRL